MTTQHQARHHHRARASQRRPVCPACGAKPYSDIAAARLREELQTDWWSTTDRAPDRIVVTQHCGRCQPHTVYVVSCLVCGDGPILAGRLAELTRDTDPQQLPAIVVDQLTAAGWRRSITNSISGWVCCR